MAVNLSPPRPEDLLPVKGVKLGDRVGMSVASDAVHWFDAGRETRIS